LCSTYDHVHPPRQLYLKNASAVKTMMRYPVIMVLFTTSIHVPFYGIHHRYGHFFAFTDQTSKSVDKWPFLAEEWTLLVTSFPFNERRGGDPCASF